MCHNSILENEQIEKCIENGMPHKIIKTIKYTMRKRAANEEDNQKHQKLSTNKTNNNKNYMVQNSSLIALKNLNSFALKCPFGHGSFSDPQTTSPLFFNSPTLASLTLTPSSPTSNIDKLGFLNSSNNNNNLYERFSQISQLNTNIATDNDDVSNISNNNNENNNDKDNDYNIMNLSGHFEEDLFSSKKIYNDDILAKGTQLTRQFAYTMQQAIRRLQSSKIYTLLTKTTQPAHVVAIGVLLFVLFTVWPELIDGTANSGHHTEQQRPQEEVLEMATSNNRQEPLVKKNDMLALIAYLGAFSTHFGSQIWMTFVSGLSLYFSLPRHTFGQCQQILFPKYFAMNAVLSITMFILYIKFFFDTWTVAKCLQLGSLALTGVIEVSIRLYLAPPLLILMQEKYKIEDTIGSGKEIGSLVQGDLMQCPHYQRIHKAFRRIHMTVAIGNMITMAASCLHLYFIASQLQISIVY